MTDASITWLILALAFVSFLLGVLVVRRRRTPLNYRPIAAYAALPHLIDLAVEADVPPHVSLGSSRVGGESTITALASTELLYTLMHRYAVGQRPPVITLSDPVTLAVAADVLRRAYLARENLGAFRQGAVAWYPFGERSLAFAAGAAALAQDRRTNAHIAVGQFGAELAFLGEAALRRNQPFVAHSVDLQGQAVAYALGKDVLIGEELFVSGAYLQSPNTIHEASLIATDVLRWGVIVFGILLGILINALD